MKRSLPGMLLLLLLAIAVTPGLHAAQPQNGSFRIETPTGTASVHGTVSITVMLNNLWINTVQYKVDGQPIGQHTLYPYTLAWDTTGVSDGVHTLIGVGVDDANIEYTTPPVTVKVNNAGTPEPQNGSLRIAAPGSSARVLGTEQVTIQLNNLWLNTVQF